MSAMRVLVVLPLLLAATACTVLPSSGPAPSVYGLVPPPETSIVGPGDNGILLVESSGSVAGFDTEAMVYRESDQALDRFTTGRWAAPPGQLLTEAAANALQESGRFRAVLMAPAPVAADYRLHLTVLRLEQDYRRGIPGVARISARVRLTDSASGELLTTALLSHSEPAEAAGPAAFAAAASVATRRLLAELDAVISRELDDSAANGEAQP